MAKQEQAFSNKTIRSLLDTHRAVTEIKYLYLKIVQSHNVKELAKAEFKGSITELASAMNSFFNDLRFKKINKFNIDDVEKNIEKFIRETEKRIRKVRKNGLKLAFAKIHLDRIPAGEAEIDSTLMSSRVFEEQALEKDKLDYLNAIKNYLVEATGGAKKVKAKSRAAPTDRALMDLKIRNFVETFTGYNASNLDILYKVRTKVDKALKNTIRVNAVAGPRGIPAVLNHNELYLYDHGNGNYSISFRDANIAVLLEILLVQQLAGTSPLYRGEISGWAETGANRVEFILKDKRGGSGIEIDDPLSAEAVMEFLKKAEMYGLYAQIRQACQARSGETGRLQQKVREEVKRRVSEALDDIL